MNLTRASLLNPAAVFVFIALLALFGLMSIASRPVQLLPELTRPQISVFNNWREAAPSEMESYIVEPMEAVLRRTPGVQQISSNINRGFGQTTLTFDIGTDMQAALINVINNVNQAPPLPVDAGEPFVASGQGGQGANVATLQIYPSRGNNNDDMLSDDYVSIYDDVVEPRLARIAGVSRVNMNGRRPFEVRITFDPYRAAAAGVSINSIVNTVSQANDVSGGFANVGRRQYTVRFIGKDDVDKIADLIVDYSGTSPIRIRDIATVEKQLADPFGINKRNGYSAFYISLEGSNDANTVQILDEVNAAIAELNDGALKDVALTMELSFDSSVYIRRAIALVKNNIGLGVLLSVGVLWVFLRSSRATLMIAASIPVSMMVAFIALRVFNISLNVISLAGLAFAVGLVLDAAIIVQENIVRYRQQGMGRTEAIQKGADQVKGALFASTVTTVAIFLPVLFMPGQAGQMFSDLALTLSVAVVASMVTALTVIPVANKLWLSETSVKDPMAGLWERVTGFIMTLTRTTPRRVAWIVLLVVVPIAATIALKPKADFLPSAAADAVTVVFSVPPGVNHELFEDEIASEIVARLRPYMDHEQAPFIRGYNLSMFGTFNILYLYPLDPADTEAFVELLRGPLLRGIPDTQPYTSRASLLGMGFNSGRTISVDLQGADVIGLMDAASAGMERIREVMPGATARPVPGLSLSEPELQVIPNEQLLTQAGLNRSELARAVRAVTGGLFINEYFDGNNRYNVILRAGKWDTPEQLGAMPIITPRGGVQTIGALADIQRTVGPTSLSRFDGQRTISLQVIPPDTMTLEEALDILRSQVGPTLRDALPDGSSVKYRGSADELDASLRDMLNNFLLAIVILFLIMAAIFKSIRDSLLVLSVMPLAVFGGVAALRLLNVFSYQSLDMLTMIGFIILLGLVVNNAILLVNQTRDGERGGLSREDAVRDAVRLRARPVYMSTMTSIFGMLPLAFVPGVGSDIYRGLAIVIVGGMLLCLLFTLVLMPSLLRLGSGRSVNADEPGSHPLGGPAHIDAVSAAKGV
ncbi:MAG: efflux RND transporter permease subunit [Gammaproteobacteria bacterium]